MHELSVALQIMDAAQEEMSRQKGRLAAIHLRLGPLAGVVREALESAYEMAREGTELESADLVIEEVPLLAYCPGCSAEKRLASPQELCCPDCGAPASEIRRGRELEIFALEIAP
jgi:hydrogenase nickel incorporation protein HypA/HybF